MDAKDFVDLLLEHGFSEFVGVPCSYLSPLINCLENDEKANYVNVVNEGIALAYSLGNHLSGKKTVILMQNSGLGNIFNLYTSYIKPCGIATLFIISLRKNSSNNQEQHEFMGENLYKILKIMEFEIVPVTDCINDLNLLAISNLINSGVNVALIVEDKSTFKYYLPSKNKFIEKGEEISRKSIFEYLRQRSDNAYYFVGLGYNSRDFYYFFKEKGNVLYVTGAMGYVSAIALGFAKNNNDNNKIVIIDSDGALLMHMENLSMLGQSKLKNIIHIVLDNNSYNTTGEQQTISNNIDFCLIAKACGYEEISDIYDFEDFKKIYNSCVNMDKISFLRIHIKNEHPVNDNRPYINIKKCCNSLKNYCLED